MGAQDSDSTYLRSRTGLSWLSRLYWCSTFRWDPADPLRCDLNSKKSFELNECR
jgi:hypothetical protein